MPRALGFRRKSEWRLNGKRVLHGPMRAEPFDRRFRPYAILGYALAEVVEMVDTRS